MDIIYNVNSTQPCIAGHQFDNRANRIVFEGFEMRDASNELYLLLENASAKVRVGIVDYTFDVTTPLTVKGGKYNAQLEERTADDSLVAHSDVFTIIFKSSIDADAEYEQTDIRMDTMYEKYNAKYNEVEDLRADLVEKVDEGYFDGKDGHDGKDGADGHDGKDGADGKDGDNYTITSADYEAIAEKVKPYDDTELREEIHRTDDRLDALWKINEGQTYDVLESASEDYAKVVPSGSHYASGDVVGGKSVVWNQLIYNGVFDGSTNWTNDRCTITTSNNVAKLKPTAQGIADGGFSINRSGSAIKVIPSGNVVFMSLDVKPTADITSINLKYGNAITKTYSTSIAPNVWNKLCFVYTPTSDAITYYEFVFRGTFTDSTECEVRNARTINLTQMGYGDITSTDDIRIKLIEAYAEEHPEYNDGEIISSIVDAVEVRGKNNWKDTSSFEWTKGTYTFTRLPSDNRYLLMVKAKDGKSIPSDLFFGFTNNGDYGSSVLWAIQGGTLRDGYLRNVGYHYLSIFSGGRHELTQLDENLEICLVEGTADTYPPNEFVPYRKQTITTSFPILRSAGSVYDYIDLNKGELHRRVGVVDLGTLPWNDVGNYWQTVGSVHNVKDGTINLRSAIADGTTISKLKSTDTNKIAVYYGAGFYTPKATYSNMPNGLIHYELSEEIIEPIDIPQDLTEWLECEPNGTITFVNDQKLLVPNTERFIRKLNEVT